MELQLSTVCGELHAPTALSLEKDQTRGLVDPKVSTDILENIKVSCPCLELQPPCLVIQPTSQLYTQLFQLP